MSLDFRDIEAFYVLNETIAVLADVVEQPALCGRGDRDGPYRHRGPHVARATRDITTMLSEVLTSGETSINGMSEIGQFGVLAFRSTGD